MSMAISFEDGHFQLEHRFSHMFILAGILG